MNAFQTCKNTSDAIPLYLPQELYLKPLARMNISVQLPQQKIMGKNISNWEMMEKLRSLITPDEFTLLKVTKSNLEFIRFEAEVEDKSKLERVINKLDNKMIKLKDITEWLRVRAAMYKQNFPTRHTWDSFFREAKNMNEMKPGERPDTIHISHLPTKWFVPYHLSDEEGIKPSEKIFYRVFEKFGNLRYVDIPICDPYRHKMKSHMSGMQTFSYEEQDFFEGYVQFKDYIGFTKAMNTLRGMKLLRKEDDGNYTVNIKVDFDKTKHLSDASIRRREIVRERLIMKQKNQEEKEKNKAEEEIRKEEAERQKEVNLKNEREKRRREREEKRKAKILAKLKLKGADEINEKIAKEEKKLLKVQRKLEAIRLVEALFKRINEKKENDINSSRVNMHNTSELAKLKISSESEVRTQREKLHRAIAGRVMLKSILAESRRVRNDSSSSSNTSYENEPVRNKSWKDNKINENISNMPMPDWYNFSVPNGNYPYVGSFHPYMRGLGSDFYHFPFRGRGMGQEAAGPSRSMNFFKRGRGFNSRGRFRGRNPRYPPELAQEYYKYFYKFLHEENNYSRRSRSNSFSRHSRSSSRRRSSSRSRSRSRSSRRRRLSKSYGNSKRSTSRSRSVSRERPRHSRYSVSPRNRNNRRSRSRSRRKSISRSLSKSRSRNRTPRRSRSRTPRRSRSRTPRRSRSRTPRRSRSRTPRRSKSKTPIKSRSRTPRRSKSETPRRSKSRTPEKSKINTKRRSPIRSRSKSERNSRSRSEERFESTPKRSKSKSSNKNSARKSTDEQLSPGSKSVDSSVFISPSRLIRQNSKSKSPVQKNE